MIALSESKYEWAVQSHSMAQLSTEVLGFWRCALNLHPNLRHAFMTPTYCQAVDASLGGDVRVLLVYRDERLVALLPVQPGRRYPRWSGIWAPVGGAMCDYFGFICQDYSVQLNVSDLMRKAGIGAIEYSHLDETQLLLGLPMGTPRVGLRTVISGDGSLDWEQLRNKNKKLVTDTERRERKLVSDHGPLTFELQSTQPEADLEQLVALKRAQYARTGEYEAVLFNEEKVSLLQKLLSTRSPECSGLLSVLRVNGNMVAAHFGLRCDKVLHYWFPVYSEKFASYSPGRILYRYVMTEGKVVGISTIDRGEGDTSAKREFATHEHHFIKGVWWNKGASGLVARGILSLSWRIGLRKREGLLVNENLTNATALPLTDRSRKIQARKYSEVSASTVMFWHQAKSGVMTSLNPFVTYGFAKACHDIGRDVRVFEFYEEGQLVAIFPCQFSSPLDRLLGVADRVGGSMSDFMGIVPMQRVDNEDLLRCPGVRAIRFDHFFLRTFNFDADFHQTSADLRVGWLLDLHVDFDRFMEQRLQIAKKRLQNLENRKRKIVKEVGPLRLESKAHPSAEEISRVVHQKSRQYQAGKVKDVFSSPHNVELLMQLSRNAEPSATLLLTDLFAGDALVASHLGLQNGEFLNYWFPVYGDAYKEYSPGLILLSELVRAMRGYGLRYLDFGEGDSDYKRIYANYKYWNSKRFDANDHVSGKLARYPEMVRWRINKYVSD